MKNAVKHIFTFLVLIIYLLSSNGLVITYGECNCTDTKSFSINEVNTSCCRECDDGHCEDEAGMEDAQFVLKGAVNCCSHKTLYVKDFTEYSDNGYKTNVKIISLNLLSAPVSVYYQNEKDPIPYIKASEQVPKPYGRSLLIRICTSRDYPSQA
jgi:hypothetical protein